MTVTLANTPVLETERLALRAPKAEDWPHWRTMALSERAEFITVPDVDEEKAWRGMGHIIGHWVLHGWGSFIITMKGDDTTIGLTGPWYPAGWPEKELGWAIWSPEAEGMGIAFEAASAARNHAFQTLNWDTAVSYVDPANARSIALAERLGATLDQHADTPRGEPCLVYRHPTPEGA